MPSEASKYRQAADSAASAAEGLDVGTTTGAPAPAPAASSSIGREEAAKADGVAQREAAAYGIQTGRVLDDPREIDAKAGEQAAAAALGGKVHTVSGRAPPAPEAGHGAAEERRGDEVEYAEEVGAGIKLGKVVPNP